VVRRSCEWGGGTDTWRQIDLCVSNAIVKTGIGFSAGVVLSVLLLRRRTWPVWLGTGFGLGAGYTDCERSFNPVSVPGVRLVPASEALAKPGTQFQLLQQRAGEWFGNAKSQANEAAQSAAPEAQELRDRAHARFEQIGDQLRDQAQQGMDQLRDGADQLRDRAGNIAENLSVKTQDARDNVADAIRSTPVPLEEKTNNDPKVRTI